MRAAANKYGAKVFECLSLAECMTDPERRADSPICSIVDAIDGTGRNFSECL
jgi:hypothetical protein